MRAMVLDEFGGEFRLEQRPVPEPGHGEVLVRCLAVGAGVTNELARDGSLGGSVPRVHGHELSGDIVTVGAGVEGWSAGDQVTTSFYLLCQRCDWCTSGRETLCESSGGLIGVAVDGAFADYVVLPAANPIRIPDGVDVRDAGIIGDAVATPYHVVTERLRMRAGERVAVLGAGGGESWAGQVRDAADGAVAGLVDTVATSATLNEGYRALGRAGCLVALGHVPGAELRIDPERLLLEELVVAGTRYATRAEIARTMELVRLGRVEPIIGARFPLERLEDALRRARDADVFGRIKVDVAGG